MNCQWSHRIFPIEPRLERSDQNSRICRRLQIVRLANLESIRVPRVVFERYRKDRGRTSWFLNSSENCSSLLDGLATFYAA